MTPKGPRHRARVLMFPGQGIQRKGMGAGVLERFPRLVARADAILGYSVHELCTSDPGNRLADSRFAQAAVYVVNALTYRAWGLQGSDFDLLLGHSLGEYNALEAGGHISFDAGLELVVARAEATAGHSGSMLAVVGIELERALPALRRAGLTEIEPANLNSRFQSVFAGPDSEIDQARTVLLDCGAKLASRLPITGAFHTRHMSAAVEPFRAAVAASSFTSGHTPVVANLTALPHSPSGLRRDLLDHLTHPVLWRQSVEWVLDSHGDPDLPEEGVHFEEASAERVLTRLVTHIRRDRSATAHSRR